MKKVGFEVIKSREVAEILGVCQATLCHWRKAGIGPRWFKATSSTVFYKRHDVYDWVARSVASRHEKQVTTKVS